MNPDANNWILSINQLPEEGVEVLGWNGMWYDGEIEFCKIQDGMWMFREHDDDGDPVWWEFADSMTPTMWTPIPKLPIEP